MEIRQYCYYIVTNKGNGILQTSQTDGLSNVTLYCLLTVNLYVKKNIARDEIFETRYLFQFKW